MKLQWQEKERGTIECHEARSEKVTAQIRVMPEGGHFIGFSIDGAKTVRQDKWLAEKIVKLIEEAI